MNRLLAAARGRAAVLVAGGAIAALAVLAAAVPSASGAFSAKITNSQDLAGTATYFRCDDALAADRSAALFQWPLTDASGSTAAADSSGNGRTGAYQGTMTADASTPIACPRDGGTAWRLDGSTNYADYATAQSSPQVFTIEVAFQTTAKAGRLIGFGSAATGASTTYDRHLYINSSGLLVFGIYSGGCRTLVSKTVVTDGAWHHAAATLSSAGMKLYLDGVLVDSSTAYTTAETNTGYWRVGYDSLGGSWPNVPASPWFSGRMRDAAVYTSELSAQQIAAHAAPIR